MILQVVSNARQVVEAVKPHLQRKFTSLQIKKLCVYCYTNQEYPISVQINHISGVDYFYVLSLLPHVTNITPKVTSTKAFYLPFSSRLLAQSLNKKKIRISISALSYLPFILMPLPTFFCFCRRIVLSRWEVKPVGVALLSTLSSSPYRQSSSSHLRARGAVESWLLPHWESPHLPSHASPAKRWVGCTSTRSNR